jgi:hypothetical protein
MSNISTSAIGHSHICVRVPLSRTDPKMVIYTHDWGLEVKGPQMRLLSDLSSRHLTFT